MMMLLLWIMGAAGLIALAAWWLLIHTEGVYLGRRVVIWLYDVYASRYDAIVQIDDVDEHLHLAQPIMRQMYPNAAPLVLDVATGTGRLPLALCQHARFEGQIIALDRSAGMLAHAIKKIHANHFENYTTFLLADGGALPFPDDRFDMVTCLEALEFMPDSERGLRELLRVLRPDGVLLTTRRINEPLMPGRLWSQEAMADLLQDYGCEAIEFETWQYDYQKVWARKRAYSAVNE